MQMKNVLLIAIVGLFLCFGQAFAALYTVSPTDDSRVTTFAPTANFGSDTGLSTTFNLSPSAITTTFLKFNLSSIPAGETITSATLYLYKSGGAGDSGTTAYFVSTDSWAESTITANNAPALGSAIGSNSTLGTQSNSTWLNWVLTLTPQMTSDSVLSMALQESVLSGISKSHTFFSSEAPSFQPYLEVQTTAVPIPGAVWLLGSGLLGLVAFRRRFKK
jgi:hypothetical protein